MEPNVWGPHAWHFLHAISFNYPNEPTKLVQEKAFSLFDSLKDLLPCIICQLHYRTHFNEKEVRDAVTCRSKLMTWVIKLHNTVNRSLNKPEFTQEEVIEHYQKEYTAKKRKSTTGKVLLQALATLLIVLVAVLLTCHLIRTKCLNPIFFQMNK